MAEITIDLPSGARGRVQGIKLGLLRELQDSKAIRAGTALENVLRATWVGFDEPGPYDPRSFEWRNALQGDRIVALIGAKRATHGDHMDLDLQCAHRRCRAKIAWRVDLSELPAKAYPEVALEAFKARKKFVVPMAGKTVTFELATGETEAKVARVMKEVSDPIMASIEARIEVDGMPKRDVRKWLDTVEGGELGPLWNAMQDTAGGVETIIEAECKICGNLTPFELPFRETLFWMPPRQTSEIVTR